EQRNGYGLDALVRRSIAAHSVSHIPSGDENDRAIGHAVREATGGADAAPAAGQTVGDAELVVLGSGNLGLVYLMAERRRLPLEEGCAFEELISFHGGIGGPQTRPFLLYPAWLPAPEQPLIGAEAVHDVLVEWRRLLNCASPPLAAVLRAPAGVRVRAASR